MISVRLTNAQRSALECAGLEEPDEENGALAAAWDGVRMLTFDEAGREAVRQGVWEAANSEDAMAEDVRRTADERKSARGARTALENLAVKLREAK